MLDVSSLNNCLLGNPLLGQMRKKKKNHFFPWLGIFRLFPNPKEPCWSHHSERTGPYNKGECRVHTLCQKLYSLMHCLLGYWRIDYRCSRIYIQRLRGWEAGSAGKNNFYASRRTWLWTPHSQPPHPSPTQLKHLGMAEVFETGRS